MNFPLPFVVAQAAPAAKPGFSDLLGGPFVFIILMFVLMYFMMIRPQQKRQKEMRQMLSALAKGDEVVTSGGIAGRVEELGDSFVTVEIAPSVKIKLQKSAVTQVLPKGSLKSS